MAYYWPFVASAAPVLQGVRSLLPGRDGVYWVEIGTPDGDDRMAVAHGMRVVVEGERVQLLGEP